MLCDEMAAVRTAAFLQARPCSWSDEDSLQAHLASVLGEGWVREHVVGGDRFDLWHAGKGIAVEVKVQGAPAPLLRQLIRYAERSEVRGIVLVTNRPSLARAVPQRIGGKPVAVAEIQHWAFRRL